MGAVLVAAILFVFCLLRCQRNRRDGGDAEHQLAVVAVAALLEAAQEHAQGFLHLLGDKKDAVKVVGHHLQGEDPHLGVVLRGGPPLVVHALAQWRQLDAGHIVAACRGIAPSHHSPE